MIIDSSAIVAISLAEPSAEQLSSAIERSGVRHMSVASFVEASIVLQRQHGPDALAIFDQMLVDLQVQFDPIDLAQARIAREAYREFGRGSGHPARLNFGDCFSYALAKVTGEPLLATGDDSAQTDIAMVAWR